MSPGARALTVAAVGLVVLGVAGGATAQQAQPARPRAAAQKPRAAAPAQPAGPAVGSTATYRWTSALTQTVPVVVQQAAAGGQVTWSVAQETAPPAPIFVTYSVPRGDRRSYTLQIVTQAQPDGPPLSVTHVTVDRASGKALRSVTRGPKGPVATPESGLRPLREAAVPQGQREEVTVPAGRVSAVHGTAPAGEAWVSDQVPPLGVVKLASKEGTLELLSSSATGAKDLLRVAAQ
jgi:hypothetical protein